VNMKLSTNAWVLIPVGLVFFVIYYVLFRVIIQAFNLKTPGRSDDPNEFEMDSKEAASEGAVPGATDNRSAKILANIGGPENIESVDACITRLRLVVKDDKQVNDAALKQLGASGVMRLGKGAVQVVFGPQSEAIKDDIKKML